ncbi:MAG: PepSY domain-containing protein [Gammaproteobacteria bacterium]|nr:PepSY domain-containing protein [Gammaproteobacteria bacterium]MDH5591315.1 PepSY domain-containing protein [Gammaproteobacteria bacterium]
MNRRMRSLYHSLGIIVALFTLLLATTGSLLNHTTEFELDKRYLTWDWILKYYNMDNVQADAVYLLDQNVVSQFGSQVFIDATPVTQAHRPLLGGIVLDDLIVLATDDALLLFSPEGEFIERMGASAGVPPAIQNIGLFHGEPVIQSHSGMWRSDFLLESWEQISLQGVGWSVPQPMPDSVEKQLAEYFHGKGISIERFILDLHNGHIFGKYGVWLLDALALLLVALSLTGLWLWCRRL